MDLTPMMVCTHSYRMAFPALRAPSVLVATYAPAQLVNIPGLRVFLVNSGVTWWHILQS